MKRAHILILLAILGFGLFLRVYKLGIHPGSAYGDEISFAWNAWSILKTGADEHGVRLPLQFRAFDDYKSPIPVYLLVPLFYFFGMSTFIVRLPVALFGTGTIFLTYLLGRKLHSQKLGIIGSLLIAISPWHVHLSRGYFEVTIGLFFFLAAVCSLVYSHKNSRLLYVGSIFFAASFYTYFIPRMLIFLFLPFLFWYLYPQIKNYKRHILYSFLFLCVLSAPLVKLALFDHGANRLSYLLMSRMERSIEESTKEFSNAQGPTIVSKVFHNRYQYFVKGVLNDYLEHFSVNFWYIFGDNSLRYFLGKMGMFYLIELPFLLIGIAYLITKNQRLGLFFLIWLLITPIPTALVGKSFAIRSMSMLPIPFFIVGLGVLEAQKYFNKHKYIRSIFYIAIIIFAVSVVRYNWRYHNDYQVYGATWWGYENKKALDYAQEREGQYENIFISDFYSGAPLAYAYYRQLDPKIYQEAIAHPVDIADGRRVIKIGKYYFGSLDLNNKRIEAEIIPSKTLYVGRPEEPDGSDKITAPDDGRILFKIHVKE